MAGLIPPDQLRDAAVAPALGGPDWPAIPARHRAEKERGQARAPLPVPLLASGVAALDAGAMGLAALLAQASTAQQGHIPLPLIALVPCLLLLLGGALGAYSLPALFGRGSGWLALLVAAALATTIPAATSAALDAGGYGLGMAALWFALAVFLLLMGRLLAALLLRLDVVPGHRRSILLGAGTGTEQIASALQSQGSQQGLRLIGVAGADFVLNGPLPHLAVDSLVSLIRRNAVDQILVTPDAAASARLTDTLRGLADCPVDVLAVLSTGGHRLVPIQQRPIAGWAAAVKMMEDYLLVAMALLVAAVPMALIALAIRLDSPGPVFFRQRRVGFNNRDFLVFKFRTMYHDATDHEVRRQIMPGDPRITRVGAVLRRTSLDELPQILNVLQGDMSFVGPRPHAPGTLAAGRRFHEVAPRYAARHRVKPGLTGLAQVRGWRGPTDTEEKLLRRVESDLEYIEAWSPWLDMTIVLRTALEVARMRNAV